MKRRQAHPGKIPFDRYAVIKSVDARPGVRWSEEFYETERAANDRVRQVNTMLGHPAVKVVFKKGTSG